MKCPHCNETDHEPTAKYCHVCGYPLNAEHINNDRRRAIIAKQVKAISRAMLSENSSSTHTPSEKKNAAVWIVASFLLVAISVIEWLILGATSIISIIWNIIIYVGFMSDWYKFQERTAKERIRPYYFMVPASVVVCIAESILFSEYAIIITGPIVLMLTELLFKSRKK